MRLLAALVLAGVATAGALAVETAPDPGLAQLDQNTAVPSDLYGPPEPTADDRFAQGMGLEASGQLRQAEEIYRQATAKREYFPEAWTHLGHVQQRQRRFAEAVVSCRRALLQRPGFPPALECLGESSVGLGRLGEARDALARLRPLDGYRASTLERTINGTKRPEGW